MKTHSVYVHWTNIYWPTLCKTPILGASVDRKHDKQDPCSYEACIFMGEKEIKKENIQ